MSNVAAPIERPAEPAPERGAPVHSEPGLHGAGHGHGEGGHHGPHYLHHHFTDVAQQRESNAMGMWVFLITEVMTFGTLFFVYALYRYLFENQAGLQEIQTGVEWASPYATGSGMLVNLLGFINTLVLLGSSMTVAASVYCAGKRDKKGVLLMFYVTWILGAIFLGIKAYEWKLDWDEQIVPGLNWNPAPAVAHKLGVVVAEPTGVNGQAYIPAGRGETLQVAGERLVVQYSEEFNRLHHGANHDMAAESSKPSDAGEAAVTSGGEEHSSAHDVVPHPRGGSQMVAASAAEGHAFHGFVNGMHLQMFFVIYFCMAGLHAIHMVIGLGILAVFIVHARNNIFTTGNDQPVEIFGLYWHFVDIVWIFLYPLLYLIAH